MHSTLRLCRATAGAPQREPGDYDGNLPNSSASVQIAVDAEQAAALKAKVPVFDGGRRSGQRAGSAAILGQSEIELEVQPRVRGRVMS